MKKIAIDRADFEDIIKSKCVYVDKTKFFYKMINDSKYYFLSRPRRFGKSLSVNTLRSIFEGKKELFEGLYIYDTDWNWEEYPIISLDFNQIESASKGLLEQKVGEKLDRIASHYEVELSRDTIPSRFDELVVKLHQKYKKGVVFLVDEYDKPIISHLGLGEERLEIAKQNREFMKAFYDNIKPLEPYLKFVYLTGVSKFSKVSIFSTLNNLIELDSHPKYADMLGYTESELKENFDEHIEVLAKKYNKTREMIYQDLKYTYNGFRFTEEEVRVYNPFSIGRALSYEKIDSYWFESGTPTFLINLIKENQYDVTGIENMRIEKSGVKAYDIEKLQINALLFQTGYLTIKEIEGDKIYTLGYPNNEVEEGFCSQLIKSITNENISLPVIYDLKKAFLAEDYEECFELLSSIFAGIPYSIIPGEEKVLERELYYHTIFYLAVTLMSDNNFKIYPEIITNKGRIDMVIDMEKKIYIIEFKCNQSADAAIEQIKKKKYAEKYRKEEKETLLLGINLNSKEKNIVEWKLEKYC